jgi:Superfamily I DNA and RNA helicases
LSAHWDSTEEARAIAGGIEELQRDGHYLAQIAVLVRASSQMREIEERFINQAISYRVIGGPRFYERKEIRDAMAYFRLVAQPRDDLAFERIVNSPKRGIGASSLQKLVQHARAGSMSLMEATMSITGTDELGAKPRNALKGFVDQIARWRRELEQMGHVDLAGVILDESGYTGMLQAERTAEAHGRLENLKNCFGRWKNLKSACFSSMCPWSWK